MTSQPVPWSGHVCTMWPALRDLVWRPRRVVAGDFAVPIVDEHFGPTALSCSLAAPPNATDVVLVVHGLGGNRHCGYVQRAVRELFGCGMATVAVDLRGADRRGGGFYHVALAADLAAVCASPALRAFRRVYVLGFSMGGHVAIHFAASGDEPRLCGVAALCAPLDLQVVQQHLDRPALALYRRYVLSGLKGIYAAVAARHAVPSPLAAVRACRTFAEWDALTIVKRYGFATPAEFYRRQSAARVLPRLRVDTVLLSAAHDPMVPLAAVQPFVGDAAIGRLHAFTLPRGGHLQFARGASFGGAGGGGRTVVQQLAARWQRQAADAAASPATANPAAALA